MSLSAKLEKLISKRFSESEINEMLGDAKHACLSYSANETIRKNAASGGAVTGLLIELLKKKTIVGALVCDTVMKGGKVRASYSIASTPEEVIRASGSKYVQSSFAKEALPLIENHSGPLAIVGLPCDITLLKHKSKKNPKLAKNIALTIALLCGHISKSELIDATTARLAKKKRAELTNYTFRKGHWRGELEAKFSDSSTERRPFSYFSVYQNLYFFSASKCLYCMDHFGYDADISVGDVWSYDLKEKNIKASGILVKTKRGAEIVDEILFGEAFHTEKIDPAKIVEGQKRSAPFHYNISARHKASRFFSTKIPDKLDKKVKWHEFLCAAIVLFNYHWSKSERYSKWIFRSPKPFMKLYLYLFKALESLK